MLVTFYSYKGGVGRSLALANIACLLAEDEEHPQRVLLWDFDLEAPGLHRLLPPLQPHKYGFVDIAYEYAATGELPSVSDYIYESNVPNIDVLPAGVVDEDYCRKLQDLDWEAFFSDTPKEPGPFFGPLMDAVGVQGYDYVLVDSRTGLNDHAGICTQVLPDVLVFLFRLTDQNLDGLEYVRGAILSQLTERGRHGAKMMPVATAVVSTAAETMQQKRRRVEELFAVEQLDYIRFDPDLVSDEKLFCSKAEQRGMWPIPAVMSDYRKLSDRIRKENASDTRTSTQELLAMLRRHDTASAAQRAPDLLKRRPNLSVLWDAFISLWLRPDLPSDIRQEFQRVPIEILQRDPANVNALTWQAKERFAAAASPQSDELTEARDLVTQVIKLDPQQADHHQLLADIASCRGELGEAVEALRKARHLSPSNAKLLLDLAMLHMRMGAHYFAPAAEELGQAPDRLGPLKQVPLAYLMTFLDEPDKAREAFEAYQALSQDCDRTQQVRSHLLLLEGMDEKAIQLAEQALGEQEGLVNPSALLNWAEFFICAFQFSRAEELLTSRLATELLDENQRSPLIILSQYLDEADEKHPQVEQSDVVKHWEGQARSFAEFLMFRERAKRMANLSPTKLEVFENIIRQQSLSQVTILPVAGLGAARRWLQLRTRDKRDIWPPLRS